MAKGKSLYQIFTENMKPNKPRNTVEKAGGTTNFIHKDDLLNKKAKQRRKNKKK